MKPETSSLNNLRDIAVPPPVSWWPLAPGWWFVIMIVASVLSYIAYLSWRTWYSSAYRREALNALAQSTTIAEVSNVLKRTALAKFPRSEVAALSGEQWCTWLQRTGKESLSNVVQKAFTIDVFTNADLSSLPEVLIFAESWIRTHKSSSDEATPDLPPTSAHTLAEASVEC